MKSISDLDDPDRVFELRAKITGKPALKYFYSQIYSKYAACLARCPLEGQVVELGSGAGFVKQVLPEVLTSDMIAYDGIDCIVDATQMPFADNSLRAIFMLNVFHHIPDSAAFLSEAVRCLKPGGRILMIDQHVGWISSFILRYAHQEPFDPAAKEWRFDSSGPLSGANGALAWIVFRRDLEKFKARFPSLRVERYQPHAPLFYWLSGGLKSWTLLPGWGLKIGSFLDSLLLGLSPNFGSFVEIEIVKL